MIDGLVTAGCVLAGMGLGGCVGFGFAFLTAPMDPGATGYVVVSVAVGAVSGAVGGSLLAGALT